MDRLNPGYLFDAYYYNHGCGRPYERDDKWLSSFREIADQIKTTIKPETVLDAGCAMGFLVEGLRHHNIKAWGVDISEYAVQRIHDSVKGFCWVGSITDPFPQRYDLIVSIEVLEHMHPRESEKAVINLCNYSDDILFSSTPFDYKEATHFNVQPPEYWAELFANQGFFRDVDYDASYITPWAVRFRRMQEQLPRITRGYERRFWLLRKENLDLRNLVGELRNDLADLNRANMDKNRKIDDISSGNHEAVLQSSEYLELMQENHQLRQQLERYVNSRTIRIINRILEIRRKFIAKR